MPAKSEAQRKLLNARFGHAWVKKHHFDNKGKLPARVGKTKRTKPVVKKKKAGGKMKSNKKKKCAKCGKAPCKCKGY